MDPGTVLAIVGLSLQVLGGVKDYYRSWKDRDEDIKRFQDALQRLATLLEHLQTTIQKPHLEQSIVSAVANGCQTLKKGADELENMLQRVQVHGPPSSMMHKVKQMGRRACYPFRSSTIVRLMEIIEDMMEGLEFAVQLLALNTAADGQAQLGNLQQTLSHIDDNMQNGWNRLQQKEIWDWLNPPNHVSAHDHASGKRSPGSCLWFIDGDDFQTWKAKPKSLLWLHGAVGAGKTVLCSSIIEQIKSWTHSGSMHPQTRLAYYYFSCNNISTFDMELLLRSLLRQICGLIAAPELVTLHSQLSPSRPTRKELKTVLLSVLRRIGGRPDDNVSRLNGEARETFIVFDGLDELPHGSCRESTFDLIRSMAAVETSDHVHMLISSRQERDICTAFPVHENWVHHSMNRQNIMADIESFTKKQISTHPGLNSLPTGVKRMIMQSLVYNSKEMFRWTALQLEDLKSLRICRPCDVKSILNRLPKDINATYDRSLDRIDPLYVQEAMTALKWICFCVRPMFVEEVAEASTILPSASRPVDGDRQMRPSDILEILSGLVAVQPDMTEGQDLVCCKHVVSLAHFSVKEYLLVRLRSASRSLVLPLEAGLAHCAILEGCIAYIKHCHETSDPTMALLSYASSHWASHMALASGKEFARSLQKAASMLKAEEVCKFWIRNSLVLQLQDPNGWKPPPPESYVSTGPPMYNAEEEDIQRKSTFRFTMEKLRPDSNRFFIGVQDAADREEDLSGLELEQARASFKLGFCRQDDLRLSSRFDQTWVTEEFSTTRGKNYYELVALELEFDFFHYSVYYAISCGLRELVKELLEQDHLLDFQESTIYGSLTDAAVTLGDAQMVRLLADRGASFAGALNSTSAQKQDELAMEMLTWNLPQDLVKLQSKLEAKGVLEAQTSASSFSHHCILAALDTGKPACGGRLLEALATTISDLPGYEDRLKYFNSLVAFATVNGLHEALQVLITNETMFNTSATVYDLCFQYAMRPGYSDTMKVLLSSRARSAISGLSLHRAAKRAIAGMRADILHVLEAHSYIDSTLLSELLQIATVYWDKPNVSYLLTTGPGRPDTRAWVAKLEQVMKWVPNQVVSSSAHAFSSGLNEHEFGKFQADARDLCEMLVGNGSPFPIPMVTLFCPSAAQQERLWNKNSLSRVRVTDREGNANSRSSDDETCHPGAKWISSYIRMNPEKPCNMAFLGIALVNFSNSASATKVLETFNRMFPNNSVQHWVRYCGPREDWLQFDGSSSDGDPWLVADLVETIDAFLLS